MTATHLTFTESEIEPNRFAIQASGNWLMSITHNGEQVEQRQRENLRRLVACWNAFEGVSTDAIESAGKVATKRKPTLKQALEAHRMLRNWIKAVPQEVVLPAMPGIDGDWLDEVERNLCTALAQPEAEPIAADQGTIIIEMDCGAIQSTISKGVTASFVVIERDVEYADEDSIVQIDGSPVSVYRYSVNGGDDGEVDRVLAQLGENIAGQSSTP